MTQITESDYFKLHGDVGADKAAARSLLVRVNALLLDAAGEGIELPNDQISGNPVVSGYRPAAVNARTSNAAALSKHMLCRGVDLQDTFTSRKLARFCLRNNCAMLRKHGLYMEDPRWTAGRSNTDPWVHLQDVPPGSGKHCYLPYRDVVKNPPQSAPLTPEQAL